MANMGISIGCEWFLYSYIFSKFFLSTIATEHILLWITLRKIENQKGVYYIVYNTIHILYIILYIILLIINTSTFVLRY